MRFYPRLYSAVVIFRCYNLLGLRIFRYLSDWECCKRVSWATTMEGVETLFCSDGGGSFLLNTPGGRGFANLGGTGGGPPLWAPLLGAASAPVCADCCGISSWQRWRSNMVCSALAPNNGRHVSIPDADTGKGRNGQKRGRRNPFTSSRMSINGRGPNDRRTQRKRLPRPKGMSPNVKLCFDRANSPLTDNLCHQS